MQFLRSTWIPLVLLVVLFFAAFAAYSRLESAPISSFEECVEAGNPVMESYPEQCSANGLTFTREAATSTGTLPGLSSEDGSVRVYAPRYGSTIGLPLQIAGEARAFEGNVQWRLLDADGAVLASGFTTALSPEMGEPGPFTVRASYPQPKGAQGTLEVFTTSAEDGSTEGMVRLPVTFPDKPSTSVQAYFGSRERDPDSLQCETTYPVTRRVVRDGAPARAALEELLAGPTPMEGNRGAFTSIPSAVRLLSLSIANGVARADFSEELREAAGGSCRVSAVRSQIERTLRQFPTVQRVEILVGGKADVLEP